MNNNHIEKLRNKVDAVDRELVLSLAKRSKITKQIIALKKEAKLPVKDKNREADILLKTEGLAKESGLNQKFTADLFKIILKESKKSAA